MGKSIKAPAKIESKGIPVSLPYNMSGVYLEESPNLDSDEGALPPAPFLDETLF